MRFDLDLPTVVAKPLPKTVPAPQTGDEDIQPNISSTVQDMENILKQTPTTDEAWRVYKQLKTQLVDHYQGQEAMEQEDPATFQPGYGKEPTGPTPAEIGQAAAKTGQAQATPAPVQSPEPVLLMDAHGQATETYEPATVAMAMRKTKQPIRPKPLMQ